MISLGLSHAYRMAARRPFSIPQFLLRPRPFANLSRFYAPLSVRRTVAFQPSLLHHRFSIRSFATATKRDFSEKKEPGKMSSMIREYGPLAIGVYFFFSSITFVCCLSSIYFLGVDREMILRWVHNAKVAIGLESEAKAEDSITAAESKSAPVKDNEDTTEGGKKSFFDFLPEVLKTEAVLTLGTNVLLAMVMTKLFVPVKLGLVAVVTPVVARRLRAMGFDMGQRGAYKSAATNVRNTIKERRNQ
ncbi:hypothetical protein CcCBS67573_g08943 [Chytriomyces confervae]|uniref:DUF1279 domain-containing protein n=1 Tax=Chytriomyces confervae TaxID=246404 RepID=A0A507EB05_9FUNG|nr:hypothetical protein CcCBS67573_g08943 [Chytriomyces confervae]